MNTFPTLVGFYLAIGVGLIANTLFTIFYDLGRRFYHIAGAQPRPAGCIGVGQRQRKRHQAL